MSTVTQKSMELNTTRCSSRSSDKKKEWCERCIFQAIRLHNLIDKVMKIVIIKLYFCGACRCETVRFFSSYSVESYDQTNKVVSVRFLNNVFAFFSRSFA